MEGQDNFVDLPDKLIALNLHTDNHMPIMTQLLSCQKFVS